MKYIFCLSYLLVCINAIGQPVVANTKDTIGSSTITYQTTCFGKNDRDVVFINVHENENTSVKAAKEVLGVAKKYCVTQLQFRNMRFITFVHKGKSFTIDPNRIYTAKGALTTLKKNSHAYAAEIFTAAQKLVVTLGENYTSQFVDDKKLVVALHNNTNGEPLSIISYKSGSEADNAAAVNMNLQQDPDDFFFTTDISVFNFLKQKGFNVALQDNEKVLDDGSLSVYAGKKKIPYINIEAQVGHIAEQKKMIEAVLEYLKTKNQ